MKNEKLNTPKGEDIHSRDFSEKLIAVIEKLERITFRVFLYVLLVLSLWQSLLKEIDHLKASGHSVPVKLEPLGESKSTDAYRVIEASD